MSLAMPYPARRRATTQNQTTTITVPAEHDISPPGTPPAVSVEQVWHVGLSRPGMFPFREASCPCAKAACGLVVPDPEVDCPLHTDGAPFLQVHSAVDCDFPRTGWRRRRRPNLR
ncbi:hypothetical protein GCM10022223_28570 [Kineosporia mesophila]|uniref:Uncharacterized protein n=1 Tax=Kineosporia mesophila TaxID=566012 RepID=A0ABP6ZIF1_9ACTN|nr:hypothetical protein [Kineosporia mesophila]MCD5349722.1 hypothetical protein [Kineosporia mesophila]